MWLTEDEQKDANEANLERNWIHYMKTLTLKDDQAPIIVYNAHKSDEHGGHLGTVTTSPTHRCFRPFRDSIFLYIRVLRGLFGVTDIPFFFDLEHYQKTRMLRPMNEEQLAKLIGDVTYRCVGKRLGCQMLRTIFASHHAQGLEELKGREGDDSDEAEEFPASGLSKQEVSRAMLHTYGVHEESYVLEVPL